VPQGPSERRAPEVVGGGKQRPAVLKRSYVPGSGPLCSPGRAGGSQGRGGVSGCHRQAES
jgi:hypothetical protein